MAGVPGRSGRPKQTKKQPKGDGIPQSPRKLSQNAQKHFDWLCERLGTSSSGSPWNRIDGATLATVAGLLESEEALAEQLQKNPLDERLIRLRIQLSDRIFKYSGIVGMSPRDRQRLPQASDSDLDDASEWEQE